MLFILPLGVLYIVSSAADAGGGMYFLGPLEGNGASLAADSRNASPALTTSHYQLIN